MTPKKLIIVDQDGKKIDNHLKIVVVNDPGLISKISNTKVALAARFFYERKYWFLSCDFINYNYEDR